MEENNYNYIRFETKEEQDKSMPLEITPKARQFNQSNDGLERSR